MKAVRAVGQVSASNMGSGRWMFTRAVEVGSVDSVCIGVRDYDPYDIVGIVDWLAARDAGYPRALDPRYYKDV